MHVYVGVFRKRAVIVNQGDGKANLDGKAKQPVNHARVTNEKEPKKNRNEGTTKVARTSTLLTYARLLLLVPAAPAKVGTLSLPSRSRPRADRSIDPPMPRFDQDQVTLGDIDRSHWAGAYARSVSQLFVETFLFDFDDPN